MSERTTEPVALTLPEGDTLCGHVSFPGAPGKAAVVYVHGLGSVRGGEKSRALEEACARRGWTFAAFDFRGHGASSGTLLDLHCSGLQEDLEAARIYLPACGVRRLYPVGSSMGGWAAAWFTLNYPDLVPRAVLLAPALHFPHRWWDRLSEAERRDWKETGRLRVQSPWLDDSIGYGLIEEAERFPVERLARAWEKPLLIYHGMRDESVPYADTVALVERMQAAPVEVRLLRDGDHRLSAFKDLLAEEACRFFAAGPGGLQE